LSTQVATNGSPSVCVIFNPIAGRRRALQRLEALVPSWRSKVELWPTERPGHAVELGRSASERGFGIVAAAGGDGTVHEVANGVLLAGRPDVCLAVLPLGSADDYAYTLTQDHDGAPDERVRERRVDVGLIRTDQGVERFFVCCLGLGFGPCVTVESRRVRWLQGRLLYGFAALRAIWHHWGYLDVTETLDGEPLAASRTLMISVMLGRREGGFVMAPQARLDDGWFDVLRAGELTRWEAISLIPSLSSSGPPRGHPKLGFHQGRRLLVESRQPLVIHADGEILCRKEDQVLRVEVDLLPLRLLVRLGLDGIEE
jgi:diacylglycerol kinase (ATP)